MEWVSGSIDEVGSKDKESRIMEKSEKYEISAIILRGGKEDEELYRKCLKSLAWVDEIVEVDTQKLVGSFADWRNEGAKKARGEWLFYIDTDEEVTDELRKEIETEIEIDSQYSAFAISRQNIFLGKKVKWGGWYPDYVIRLIRKESLVGWYGELHEQPKVKGKLCYLKNPLIHRTHRSLTEMVIKTNKWSEIEAKLMHDSNHPPMNPARFASAAVREFSYRGLTKMGFMDGIVGITEIIYQTFSKLITYMKLWELQRKSSTSITG